jgi:hypothetical protein
MVFLLVMLAVAPGGALAQRATSPKVVNANQFPGADLGAKVNAADRALGASGGEIRVSGGGRIETQIVISANHTLRLGAGRYVATNTTPILLKSGSKLIGASWDAIILEPTAPGQFTIIAAYNGAQRNGAADNDILIKDVQLRGANPGFNSAPQAISLGNCSRCTVDHVWLNGTRSIGVQLGGASFDGHWAEDSKVVNSLFTRVASQNLAVVNGRNITFENNRLMAQSQMGGPGVTAIDLEPNDANDRIENVRIVNNLIDARDSELGTAGNGIVVQSGTGTTHVGPILVQGNTIIGGSIVGTVTNHISNGIFVFGGTMKDVTIRNNSVTRTGQAGLHIQGTRLVVTGNRFVDVGGGGTPGFRLVDITNSQITGNTFNYSGNGPVDSRVAMEGTNRNNIIRNNPGIPFP